MKIYKTTKPHEAMAAVQSLLAGNEGLIRYIGEKGIFVMSGQLPTFDEGFCKRFGITVGKTIYLGGTIVDFPGDLELCYVSWGPSNFGEQAVGVLYRWLHNHHIDVRIDGNDLMADNKKVASSAQTMHSNGWCQTVVHFSVHSDIRLIHSICTKPMEKIPGSLEDYGLNADIIWYELLHDGLIADDDTKGE